MIYEYYCEKCDKSFLISKPVSDYNRDESCSCGELGRKIFSLSKPVVDKTNNEYYHSLGTVVKNRNHRKELIKERGLVEVGSEKPSTLHAESAKAIEHKRKKMWDEIL